MGDIVLFPSSLVAPGGNGGDDCALSPHLGRANRLYEFFNFDPPPASGFPADAGEDRLLTLSFSPIRREWSTVPQKQSFVASLPLLLAKVNEIRWAGRRYRIDEVLSADTVVAGTVEPIHIGKLCVQLKVTELK